MSLNHTYTLKDSLVLVIIGGYSSFVKDCTFLKLEVWGHVVNGITWIFSHLCRIAQKARPSLQLEVILWMATPGYPSPVEDGAEGEAVPPAGGHIVNGNPWVSLTCGGWRRRRGRPSSWRSCCEWQPLGIPHLWRMAQKARPSLQLEVMLWMATPGYPSVTLRAHTSSAFAPFTAIPETKNE